MVHKGGYGGGLLSMAFDYRINTVHNTGTL